MNGLKRATEKNLMIFSGRANPQLAEEVAYQLGTNLVPTSAYEFANSEMYVRYEESVRGSDAFVLQSHAAPVNEWIMEHLLMVDALKRASAKRITVVMPYYGYSRQDKKHRGREPISARLIADLFKTAGANRLMSVDLHTDQIQGYFDGPVDHLVALPILSKYVRSKYGNEQLAVVSPDAGRIKVAEQWSKRLGGAPLAFIHKTRDITRPNESVANRVVGEVTGRTCILVDDMIDTGGTITKAADALIAAGAGDVIIAATHAILSGPAVDRLKNCNAREIIVTNTLPIPPERQFDKLTELSIAPLLSQAIREVFEDGSVTSLFEPPAGRLFGPALAGGSVSTRPTVSTSPGPASGWAGSPRPSTCSSTQAERRTDFNGHYYSTRDTPFAPKPLQSPRLPVTIGCKGPRMLALTAAHAEVWNTRGPVETVLSRMAALDEACRAIGRDPATLVRSVWPYEASFDSVGAMAESIRAYREVGFTEIILDWPAEPGRLEVLRAAARELFPTLRHA